LVMFAAKAEMPEKYREEVKVMNVEAPLKMLERLAELAKKERAQRELEEPSVEGEYREVSTAMDNPLTTPPQPESSPKEPTPPAKRPAQSKRSAPPPRAESPRQVRWF
jgi:hypothetical protein